MVAELQRRLWSPDVQLNAAYLKWKHFENPYIPEPLLYLAFVEGRLAAMRSAFGTRWEVGTPVERHTLPYADDLVVDSAFRGRGMELHRAIMTVALEDLARRGYRYAVNLSASEFTRRVSVRMKWREAGHAVTVHRRSASQAAIESLAGRASRLPWFWRHAGAIRRLGRSDTGHAFDRFDSRARSHRPASGAATFATATPLVDEMAQLVERLPFSGRLRHVRDRSYLQWRFKNPLRRYRFLYAGGERIEGYLVLRCALDGHDHRVSIVDWEAERDSVLEALLDASMELGRFPHFFAWRRPWDPAADRLLDRRGFRPTGRNPSVLVRPTNSDEIQSHWTLGDRALDDASNWDLRLLYSMHG